MTSLTTTIIIIGTEPPRTGIKHLVGNEYLYLEDRSTDWSIDVKTEEQYESSDELIAESRKAAMDLFNDGGYAGKSRRCLLFIGIGYIVQLNAGIGAHVSSFLSVRNQ